MRNLIPVLVAIISTGCATYKSYPKYHEYEEWAKSEVSGRPWVVWSNASTKRHFSCSQMPSRRQNECFDAAFDHAKSEIDSTYTGADKVQLLQIYEAQNEQISSWILNQMDKDASKHTGESGTRLVRDEAIKRFMRTQAYELIARKLEADGMAIDLYNEHIESVSNYNRSVAQSSENTRRSLESLNTQLRLQTLESQQRQLEYQQQNQPQTHNPYRINMPR